MVAPIRWKNGLTIGTGSKHRTELTRALVAARTQLLNISTQLSNQIRSVMKTFGLIVPKGAGRVFDNNARKLLDGNDGLATIVLPLLEAWRGRHARGRS